MATANDGNGDLVSLDEAAQPVAGAGGPTSQDSIMDAADLFQQQLDQITNWKTQLSSQMETMRRDGTKLLERQKALAIERKQLSDEKAQFAAEREQIQKLQGEVDVESKRLAQSASELEAAHCQLLELEARREQGMRELAAREKSIAEMEARHLAEDVRLREAMEQLEGQRRQLAEAQRQAAHDREQLDNQARELSARAQALEQGNQSLAGREQALAAAQQQLQQAQQELANRQHELGAQQADLQSRAAAAQALQGQLEEERQTVARLKQEAQRKLEAFENEQAEQLEALGKQTKRISERRAEIEAAEANLEETLAGRIAESTEALKQELAAARSGQNDRISQLESQIRQAESAAQAAAQSWKAREGEFQQDIAAAQGQLGKLKQELQQASASLEKVAAERTAAAAQLEKQIEQGKAEAAKWQQAIDEARKQSSGGNAELKQAQDDANAARRELKQLKIQLEQFKTAKETLEFQLEVRAEDGAKQLENLREGLTQQLAERDAQIAQLRQKLEAAQSAPRGGEKGGAASPADAQKMQELSKQVQMLEQQRNELATQLFSIQDTARRQQEEFLLAKNGLEAKLLAASERNAKLEAEKSAWKQRPQASSTAAPNAKAQEQAAFQRERLLRQARALRAFRQQVRDTQGGLEEGRAELAQQREQIRARRENLEQVKRLLEKQEMVMARKLADHNAIKTVAAVGIFVIMVLGSVFFGIYRFVRPTYRSEAVVQLAVPQDLQGSDVDTWISKQIDFVKSEENTALAWQVLRSGDVHYSMHDVRDQWLESLPSHLSVTRDAQNKSMVIRYTGPDADGVADVANALAAAYSTPGKRESTEQTKAIGLGSQVLAKATPPLYPIDDNRMMLAMMTVAGTLFVSLLLIMIFRYFIARQLKEIDQMADVHELEDAKGDLPEGVRPAIE
ncbi:MAG TPA: hypothetical protein VHM90_14235 [Phycisphaerae bacterium]|nr:hypothetical protein [Phycisphaerae bacterium]